MNALSTRRSDTGRQSVAREVRTATVVDPRKRAWFTRAAILSRRLMRLQIESTSLGLAWWPASIQQSPPQPLGHGGRPVGYSELSVDVGEVALDRRGAEVELATDLRC